ncbi:MAG: glycoside hydrolase family 32 protein [Caldilineaceae bacterium]|nr:glycoside hydrolase family 32 protein [Caldilineaceae bacterium]
MQSTVHPHSLNPAIEAAMQSVAQAIPLAARDPQRPRYHFGPPANWMNDPNGTIYANGYYQLFYQHNPYGDQWGHMHWGHARSRDLVHWEHLPIALWPSLESGEEHCFSGCAGVLPNGTPLLLYTKVGPGSDATRPDNEQWAALGNADWITWRKHPDNPILSLATHDGPPFEGDWRDPFIFDADGRTFLVLGANLDDTAAVALYEAIDGDLTRWEYRKMLHTAARADVHLSECPNFFAVGDDWVLLTSPYRPVEYEIGDFDLETLTFHAQTKGVLDPGYTPNRTTAHYYATNIIHAPDGRCILLGWVRGFPAGTGWNGCLALPRVLTIGPDRRPRQNPVAELETLRGPMHAIPAQTVPASTTLLATLPAPSLEIDTTIHLHPGQSVRLHLRGRDSHEPSLTITYDGSTLTMGATSVPFLIESGEPLHLRLFVDRSVSELFVNEGRLAITTIQPMPITPIAVEIEPHSSPIELRSFIAWELSPIP